MKKNVAYLGMTGMTMGLMEQNTIVQRGKVVTSKPENPKPIKEPTSFSEQDGIKKMISEYQLIKSGQSKKGKLKQNRIVEKIESYLDKGFLTNKDLTR
jgi:hypothetical protein